MKSVAELLKEMGLNPKASASASHALVRHLQGALQITATPAKTAEPKADESKQLSFDVEVLGQSSRPNKTTSKI